jgi:hypothetical protein
VGKVLAALAEADGEWTAAPLRSPEFEDAIRNPTKHLLTVKDQTMRFVVFRATVNTWDVLVLQREVVRSFWATEDQAQAFFGETNRERSTKQANQSFLHILIIQAADSPTGYPAVVSPVVASKRWPFHA